MSANPRPDGRESTHDPLCPKRTPITWNRHAAICHCEVIAAARADERYSADRIVTVNVNEDGLRYIKKSTVTAARGDES